MSPETPLRNNQLLAYQQAQVLAMRGGLKGNISSCPANPFNFKRLAIKISVKGCLRAIIRGRALSFPFFKSIPELHFQPNNASNLFHVSAWVSTPIFKAAQRTLNRLGVISHSGRG
jgi:hypothetical protein